MPWSVLIAQQLHFKELSRDFEVDTTKLIIWHTDAKFSISYIEEEKHNTQINLKVDSKIETSESKRTEKYSKVRKSKENNEFKLSSDLKNKDGSVKKKRAPKKVVEISTEEEPNN